MNENFKQSLSELKDIVLSLHRSAGNLDSLIQSIEVEIWNQDNLDLDDLRYVVINLYDCRKSRKKFEFANLDREEQEIWKKLIEATKQ